MRPYQSDDDYWRIRDFLRRVFLANGRHEWSWQLYRWDYWRWHVSENIFQLPLDEAIFLWETAGGEIAAVLNADNPGEAAFQVDPARRSPQLEAEMLAAAEEKIAASRDGGARRLTVWAHDGDPLRPALLAQNGYAPHPGGDHQRCRSLAGPLPQPPLPPGYTVRALGGRPELPARSWLSWRAFHPGEPDDRYEGWEWYQNVQRCPLYRRQLDLVAAAPDGALAAFATVWFDDVTRAGAFEPVGVDPDHQQRGLGKAVMAEGLRRLARLGAAEAHVNSYGEPAHSLYRAMGFTAYDLSVAWTKEW
jgi:ribosomal protein S18 acetylase RimI-like enzyme